MIPEDPGSSKSRDPKAKDALTFFQSLLNRIFKGEDISSSRVDAAEAKFNTEEGREAFSVALTRQRALKTGIILKDKPFHVLGFILRRCLDSTLVARDFKSGKNLLHMSTTFYRLLSDGSKQFLQSIVRNHPIFLSDRFWDEAFRDQAVLELGKSGLTPATLDPTDMSDTGLDTAVIVSQLFSFFALMASSGLKPDFVRDFAMRMSRKYDLSSEVQETMARELSETFREDNSDKVTKEEWLASMREKFASDMRRRRRIKRDDSSDHFGASGWGAAGGGGQITTAQAASLYLPNNLPAHAGGAPGGEEGGAAGVGIHHVDEDDLRPSDPFSALHAQALEEHVGRGAGAGALDDKVQFLSSVHRNWEAGVRRRMLARDDGRAGALAAAGGAGAAAGGGRGGGAAAAGLHVMEGQRSELAAPGPPVHGPLPSLSPDYGPSRHAPAVAPEPGLGGAVRGLGALDAAAVLDSLGHRVGTLELSPLAAGSPSRRKRVAPAAGRHHHAVLGESIEGAFGESSGDEEEGEGEEALDAEGLARRRAAYVRSLAAAGMGVAPPPGDSSSASSSGDAATPPPPPPASTLAANPYAQILGGAGPAAGHHDLLWQGSFDQLLGLEASALGGPGSGSGSASYAVGEAGGAVDVEEGAD